MWGGPQTGEDLGSPAALRYPSVNTSVRPNQSFPLPVACRFSRGPGSRPRGWRRGRGGEPRPSPPPPCPAPRLSRGGCQTAGPREPALFIRAFQLSRGSAPRGPSRLYTNARRAGTDPPHPHGPPFFMRTSSGRAFAEVVSEKVGSVEGARRLPWDPGAFPTSRSTNTRRARSHSRQRGPSWGRGGRDPGGGDRLPADLP